MSNLVAKIQLLEEKKLHFTVDHQLAMQQAKDDPDDELYERNVKSIKKRLTELAEEVRCDDYCILKLMKKCFKFVFNLANRSKRYGTEWTTWSRRRIQINRLFHTACDSEKNKEKIQTVWRQNK